MDWQVAKPWSVVAKRRVANAGGAQSGDFPGYGASQKPPYGPLDCPTTYKFPADKGPLQLVPERRAAEQNFWAAACGELQATAKPRTVRRPGQQRPIRPLAASLASSCPISSPWPAAAGGGSGRMGRPSARRPSSCETNAAAQLPQSRGVVERRRAGRRQ